MNQSKTISFLQQTTWRVGCAVELAACFLVCGSVSAQILEQDFHDSHSDLTYFHAPDGSKRPVQSVENWQARRREILAHVEQVMGPLPDRSSLGKVNYTIQLEVADENYTRKKIQVDVGNNDKLPAWLLIPSNPKNGKAVGEPFSATDNSHRARLPAVIALHQTNGRLGKDEVAGLAGSANLQYGKELAERGYVVIAPDYPSLGEYGYDFNSDPFDSGSMKGIWNHMRCVDLLCSLDFVDPDRIGAIGHSLGGHNAIFLAVFDERIQATVSSCGWTPFHDYYGGKLDGWAGERYMPRIKEKYELDPDRVPFDFYELVAALAPRDFFSCSPTHDDNFDVNGVRKAMTEASKIYKLFQAEDHLQVRYPDSQHDFPTEVRQESYRFLDQWLGRQ